MLYLTSSLQRAPMLLIIQIPTYNEEATLPATLADLPRHVAGFDRVEWLVIDDGSTDATREVAARCGVDHVVSFAQNRGLANAFAAGLDAALRIGADVIVNTDADNQYNALDIPALCAPILEGRADIVIGDRRPAQSPHFSPVKRRLSSFGSWVVGRLSRTGVSDAASGFRALSKTAALRINVLSDFTYTLESILQAGHLRLAVEHVEVRTNQTTRSSRLFTSIPSYIARSLRTLASTCLLYRPMTVFVALAAVFGALGTAIGIRFLYFFWSGDGDGHVQSLLLAVICVLVAAQLIVTGLLAHFIGHSRRLIEDTLWRVRRLELEMPRGAHPPSTTGAVLVGAGPIESGPVAAKPSALGVARSKSSPGCAPADAAE